MIRTAIYPHIFGPIDRAAISPSADPRAADGTFVPFEDGAGH